MISVIIPTLNSAHFLPRNLAPLVEGVAHGIVRQVIISDGGSTDETLAIADAAGCDAVTAEGADAARMSAAASAAKGAWFLFLPVCTVLAPNWPSEVERFMKHPNAAHRVGVFKPAHDGNASGAALAWARFRSTWLKYPAPEQGLLISRSMYDEIGGYGEDIPRRVGGWRLFELNAEAVVQRDALRRSSGV